ncbi:ribonuclease kappa-like [Penaeus chinensis]|uniref:ribonuclease kappa-like n=1 Tax=Penaeus chinensis TaxID=139456 RepID=UPI001FB76DEA|nr:ribonuclease kappa-like [Penaeus chinensis]
MKICGPKLSLCCTILSVWAIIQLGLMAIFFYVRSPAFIEDLKIEDADHHDAQKFLEAIDTSYSTIAVNCAISAGLYVVTLAVSGWQMWVNKNS